MNPREEATRLIHRARDSATWRLEVAMERIFDRRYGVTTARYAYLEDLGDAAEGRICHDPSNWLGTRRALRRLGVRRDGVFVDYGSGLGRALLVAAGFPFGRVIGV